MIGETGDRRPLGWIAAALIAGSLLASDPSGWAIFGPVKWAIVLTLTASAVVIMPRVVRLDRASTAGWVTFLGWGALISIVAVDPIHPWIGTPDRHLGLMAWVGFFLLFVAGQQIAADSLRPILRATTVALPVARRHRPATMAMSRGSRAASGRSTWRTGPTYSEAEPVRLP